jgi:hypothetical protein
MIDLAGAVRVFSSLYRRGWESGTWNPSKQQLFSLGARARRGETCGALIGCLMALGLVGGRESIEDTEQYAAAMVVANEICDLFQEGLEREFNFSSPLKSTLCQEIQERIYGRSFDIRDPVYIQAFYDAGGA